MYKPDGPGFECRLPLTGELGQVTEAAEAQTPRPQQRAVFGSDSPSEPSEGLKEIITSGISHNDQKPPSPDKTFLVPSLFPLK